MVADALSRVFEGKFCESLEITCATLLDSLPLSIHLLKNTRQVIRSVTILNRKYQQVKLG